MDCFVPTVCVEQNTTTSAFSSGQYSDVDVCVGGGGHVRQTSSRLGCLVQLPQLTASDTYFL